MQIYYLEIVTLEIEAVCRTYSQIHGTVFSEPDPSLGGARTCRLKSGQILGVRAPLSESEEPVVRPYSLVDDIAKAISKAEEDGAVIALPPMEIPGHGTCAIYIQGGVQLGFWQI